MKLILHIGMSKTGTTSLQESLYINKETLLNKGFWFVQTGGTRNNVGLVARCMCNERTDGILTRYDVKGVNDKLKLNEQITKEFELEIDSIPDNVHTVIISSEYFHSQTSSSEEIKEVYEFFRRYFDSVELVCYIRDQAQRCVSLYSTALKEGAYRYPLSSLLKTCVPSNKYYNYTVSLKLWSDWFGVSNIKVRVFDSNKLMFGDLLKDFYITIGADDVYSSLRFSLNKNESFNSVGQLECRFLNMLAYNTDDKPTTEPIRLSIVDEIIEANPGKGDDVTQQEYDEIYFSFEESNSELKDLFISNEKECFKHRKIKNNVGSSIDNITHTQLNELSIVATKFMNRVIESRVDKSLTDYIRSNKTNIYEDIAKLVNRFCKGLKHKFKTLSRM
ncbi:hypothetical protein AB4347_16915 [Vibrio breoganii]